VCRYTYINERIAAQKDRLSQKMPLAPWRNYRKKVFIQVVSRCSRTFRNRGSAAWIFSPKRFVSLAGNSQSSRARRLVLIVHLAFPVQKSEAAGESGPAMFG
jgi:hypothetical protein